MRCNVLKGSTDENKTPSLRECQVKSMKIEVTYLKHESYKMHCG